MKKFLPFLTFVFTLLIAGSSIAADTVAKINFCDADTEQEGWTSVFGTKSTYPLDLGNGLALVKVDYSTPHLGDSPLDDVGIELDNFPPTVINSCNYFANVDNAYTLGFKITGLDPGAKYTFDVYSRAWGTTEKITKFSVGDSDTITVVSTLNEEVIYFTDLQPDANGEITLDVTKLPGGYAFINGWIITKDDGTAVKQTASSNISLYPNPTTDFVQLNNLPVNSRISVFNITGKKMVEDFIHNDNHMVDMRNFKNGIYLFRVSNLKTSVQTFKIIKR